MENSPSFTLFFRGCLAFSSIFPGWTQNTWLPRFQHFLHILLNLVPRVWVIFLRFSSFSEWDNVYFLKNIFLNWKLDRSDKVPPTHGTFLAVGLNLSYFSVECVKILNKIYGRFKKYFRELQKCWQILCKFLVKLVVTSTFAIEIIRVRQKKELKKFSFGKIVAPNALRRVRETRECGPGEWYFSPDFYKVSQYALFLRKNIITLRH